MANLLATASNEVNLIPLWIMLGVYGAIILLIFINAIKFGLKHALIKYSIIAVTIALIVGGLVYLAIQLSAWEPLALIDLAIRWLPTVIFGLIVLVATLFGIWRGLRKSLILAIHAVCAGALCVAFFFILINVEEVDAGVLNFLNFFAGGDGALQRALGVNENLTTFKEVLAAYLPTLFGTDTDIGLILADNAAYIYTLVDMAFRVVIAVFSWLLYIGTVFILYIVYNLCYSQRKYKKNRIAEFVNGKTDRNYRTHRIGGGVVGLVRGVAVGLLSLSFLGSVFFIAAGGKGDGKLEDYDFGDDDINYYYQIYRSIEGYGSQGIFKILNAMSDAADTPYYLFAADLIFSGELNDEEMDFSDNIKLREEFANLTGFARDTMELFMRYGSEELNALVGGKVTDTAFDTVVQVMTRTGFKEEFNALIDAFDTQTYIINLSMSLVNSVVRNIDDVSFISVGEGERELIKLIFKKGFLTPNIPDERAIIDATGKTEAEGNDIRPYLTVKHLLNKNDAKTVLNVALSVLAGEETGDTLQLAKRIIPELEKLSILGTDKKSALNPVFGRMYCLFENLYLTAAGEDGLSYSEMSQDGVDWVGEINTLLEVSEDTLVLYKNVFEEGGEPLDKIRRLFDETDKNYSVNMEIYDKLCVFLTDSKVLGRALSTNFVYITLRDALNGVAEGIYLPRDLEFGNVYDSDGNVISYGETYQLFHGVKLLFGGENKDAFDDLLNLGDTADIEAVLNSLANILEIADENGNKLSSYLTESKILRSLISIELINAADAGNTLYVPNAAREKVKGEFVPLILKSELVQLLDNMQLLVDFVRPFQGNSTEWETEVDGFIERDDFYDLVKTNGIFEGTVAQTLNVHLGGELIVPAAIKDDIEGWITIDGKQGELINLIDALRVAEFKVSDILNKDGASFDYSDVVDSITRMDDGQLDIFFDSSVLHYTVSDYILSGDVTVGNDFVLVVPNLARQTLSNDTIDSLIKKNELISAFKQIDDLNILNDDEAVGDSGVDISSILVKLANNKTLTDGKIIPASIVASMVKNGEIADDLLAIPTDLKAQGSAAELRYYGDTNLWTDELPALIDALDELLGLQGKDENYEFDEAALNEEVKGILTTLNQLSDVDPRQTRLGVLYASVVFRNKMTEEIDGSLNSDLIEGEVIKYAKLDGYYTFDELQALADAAELLGISSFDNLDNAQNVNADNLSEVYKSVLAQGVISKKVKDTIADQDVNDVNLYDHPLAYKPEMPNLVYRECEIETLLKMNGISSGSINTKNVSGFVYNTETEETASYLLVASLTQKLLVNKWFIVPHTVFDKVNGIIQPYELMLALDSFDTLVEEGYIETDESGAVDFENIDEDAPVSIPRADLREQIFKSQIIRAKITYQLVDKAKTANQALVIDASSFVRIDDIREGDLGGERAMINKDALEKFAHALELISGEGAEFGLPDIDEASLKDLYDELDEIFESDIMKYRICEYLSTYLHETVTAINLNNGSSVKVHTAEPDEIRELINRFS